MGLRLHWHTARPARTAGRRRKGGEVKAKRNENVLLPHSTSSLKHQYSSREQSTSLVTGTHIKGDFEEEDGSLSQGRKTKDPRPVNHMSQDT